MNLLHRGVLSVLAEIHDRTAHSLINVDGCCLFHSVGYFMKLAKRPVHAHNASRDVAANTFELNTDGFHAVWDGNLAAGTAAENWEACVKQIGLPCRPK